MSGMIPFGIFIGLIFIPLIILIVYENWAAPYRTTQIRVKVWIDLYTPAGYGNYERRSSHRLAPAQKIEYWRAMEVLRQYDSLPDRLKPKLPISWQAAYDNRNRWEQRNNRLVIH